MKFICSILIFCVILFLPACSADEAARSTSTQDSAENLENNKTQQLHLCDVDGDGLDEIVVHQQIDAFGGAGQYLSRILKVDGEEICEIFNSGTSSSDGMFDTGFESEFLNGYKLKITNRHVNYSITIAISDRYADDFFDENGKGKRDISILCDSFMEFTPKDIDGDGVFEIECLQYVSLDGHADGIGYAKSALKLNTETQKFEVIQAEFVEDI